MDMYRQTLLTSSHNPLDMTLQSIAMGELFDGGESQSPAANWANSLAPLNTTQEESTAFAENDVEGNDVYFKHPEEMLNPAMRNPIFHHIMITHAVTFVIGIVGNLITVFVMIGEKKGRSVTNLFLVSLAVADLLLLLLCIPLEVLLYFVQMEENEYICKLAKYVLLLSASASVLNLCAVSLERFIVIVTPMRSRSLCTLSNCRKAIIFVWVFAILLSLPAFLNKEGYHVVYHNNVTRVEVYYCEKDDEDSMSIIFPIYQFVILFAAPGLLMMICYIFVIRELWKSTKNINILTNARSSFRRAEQRRLKDTKTTRSINCVDEIGELSSHNAHPQKLKKLNNHHRSLAVAGTASSSASPSKTGMPTKAALDFDTVTKYQKSEAGNPNPTSSSSIASTTTTHGAGAAKRSAAAVNHSRCNRGDDVKKARKQVIKMLILVVILFLGCWGPKLILTILLKLATRKPASEIFTQGMYNARVIFNLIPYIHSSFNPVIYSFMSKNFRRSMSRQFARLRTFCRGWWCGCVKGGRGSPSVKKDIPLRSRVNKARKLYGPESTFSNNYYSVSEVPSTRHTELHAVSTI